MEQSLVDHVSRGELLDLTAGDEAVDEAAMRAWGDDRTCRGNGRIPASSTGRAGRRRPMAAGMLAQHSTAAAPAR